MKCFRLYNVYFSFLAAYRDYSNVGDALPTLPPMSETY